ncbi:hypothetical protein ASG82_14760 [Mycobacterium sp. Soil538]|nr:hypothetical protein ASG82_14760 [Mycobacterium sp. Soil538]
MIRAEQVRAPQAAVPGSTEQETTAAEVQGLQVVSDPITVPVATAPNTSVSRLISYAGSGPADNTAPAVPLRSPGLFEWLSMGWPDARRTRFPRTPTTGYDPTENIQTLDANGLVTAVRGDLVARGADDGPLTFTITKRPRSGSVVVDPDGTFVYTPGSEIAASGGTDRFGVRVADVSVPLHTFSRALGPGFGRSTTTTVDVAVLANCAGACLAHPIKVIDTIEVGEAPDGVAFSPNGTRAYVANALDNTVSVIDTATNSVTATIAVGEMPRGVAVNPAGTRAYVTNLLDGTVSVIRTSTNTVVATIPVGTSAERVAVSPGGTRVYVIGSQENGSTLSVISAASNTVLSKIFLNGTGYGLAVNPQGGSVYVATQIDWLDKVDIVTNAVTHVDTNAGWLSGIAFNSLGTRVYYASRDDGTVTVRSTNTDAVIATINVGEDPRGVAMSPDGTRLYVVNKEDDTLSVIRTSTNTVLATIDVGDSPNEVAISPDGTRAYVTNSFNDSVSVLQV